MRRLGARAAAAPLRSFDDSDLDDEVASEFSRHSNPELLRRHAKRLELVWNVGKVPGPCAAPVSARFKSSLARVGLLEASSALTALQSICCECDVMQRHTC